MTSHRMGRPLSPREPGTFATRLTRARLAARLTQTAAGELLGRNLSTIKRWEAGEIVPDPLTQAGALAGLDARKRRPQR